MAENADFVKDPSSMQTIEHTALADINAGEIALQGDTYGLAYITVVSGTAVNLIFKCKKVEVPKATGTGMSFNVGDTLWLDTVALTVHPVYGTGDLNVGVAVHAAGISATHVLADFFGGE